MKKIALVHDYLLGIGGAERVLGVFHEMFPDAPIYTVVYDEKFARKLLGKDCKIYASFLQRLPLFLRTRYKYFSFLIPTAVEQLDLSGFDIVLSSCSAFSKGVITRPDTTHICYCHTPTRFLWDWTHSYVRPQILFHFLRLWDQQAARRVDYFIANSKHVSSRIRKYYGKRAKVIYPPLTQLPPLRQACLPARQGFEGQAITNYKLSPLPSDYFLIVSQLRSYKQIDIAVEAFKKLGFPLVVIGEGSEKKRLMRLAKAAKNIRFLGQQPDELLAHYYKNCKAFLFPGEEDFGLTMTEAMSYGKPVLALRRGGALEIVLEGITGEFFDSPHSVVLADGVRRILENYADYSPRVIAKRAEKFSRERFQSEIFEFLKDCCKIQS